MILMMQMPLTWEHKKEDIFRKNFLKSVGNTNENSRNFTSKDEGGWLYSPSFYLLIRPLLTSSASSIKSSCLDLVNALIRRVIMMCASVITL